MERGSGVAGMAFLLLIKPLLFITKEISFFDPLPEMKRNVFALQADSSRVLRETESAGRRYATLMMALPCQDFKELLRSYLRCELRRYVYRFLPVD